ncbi:MAG: PaaI family thioesterase [Granulosicoccaceae bacterium]
MSTTNPIELKLSVAEYNQIAEQHMPFAQQMGLQLESITASGVVMRAVYNEEFLRPGGTVSGPVMMALADAAMYALVLSRIGPVELAVTTNLSINFLSRPLPGDITAQARLLKLGKRLAVGEVSLYSDDGSVDAPVAHVTATYSIPPRNI